MTLKVLNGDKIISEKGNTYILKNYFNAGGQGTLFTEETGKYLIKLCETNTEEQKQYLVEKFSKISKFDLPNNFIKIYDVIEEPYAGYVMERLNDDFKPLTIFLQDKDFLCNLRKRLVVASIIAKAFTQLHKLNLSYCDIWPNNIMFAENDKKQPIIKIIDVDNIYVAGLENFVIGTPRYMAPEIANAKKSPDIFSDEFSLCVLIFQLLRGGHPYIPPEAEKLEIEQEDEIAATAKYGYAKDKQKNLLDADEVLTPKLKLLLEKCFTKGYLAPMQRPSSEELTAALIEASNLLVKCPYCNQYTYAFKKEFNCCNSLCNRPLKRGLVLRFYDKITGAGFEKKELVKEFVLREIKQKNIIKNFYIYDLLSLPFNADLQERNLKALYKSFMVLLKDDNQWFYSYSNKDLPITCIYNSKNGSMELKNEGILPDFGVGCSFCFSFNQEDIIPVDGQSYKYQRIARVEEK